MGTANSGHTMRVGDLAAATGLTVRALHHYEKVGLVVPPERTTAGHRRYGPESIARLYRVASLRRLGLSLNHIRQALDDQDWSLNAALRHHLAAVDAQMAELASLRGGISAAMTAVDHTSDPTSDLLEIIATMNTLDRPIRRRVSILVYRDLQAAHEYLVNVFGFTPGEVAHGPDGEVVHAELFVGDGVIWLHPESERFRLASPSTVGAATATTAVLVNDVDEHHQAVKAQGGEIIYEPTDQPYGYREYSARDCEGALWSFMKELGS